MRVFECGLSLALLLVGRVGGSGPSLICNESHAEGTKKRINWFHLQERATWDNAMSAVAREWDLVVRKIIHLYPDSKFGAAYFGTREKDTYEILSDLTSSPTGLAKIRDGFNVPRVTPDLPFDDDEYGLKSARGPDAHKFEYQTPLDGILWTALHSSWDNSPDLYKCITVNARHSPSIFGLGKPLPSSLPAFSRDTYPESAPEIWPKGASVKSVQLSTQTQRVRFELVEQVLNELDIHVIVNLASLPKAYNRMYWEPVLMILGMNSDKRVAFNFLSGRFTKGDHGLSETIIREMEDQMECLWLEPEDACDSVAKVQLFLLQEERGWRAVSKYVADEWDATVKRISHAFPTSEFGAAFFGTAPQRHYVRLSDLTRDPVTLAELKLALNRSPSQIDWPELQGHLPELTYADAAGDLEPQAPFEPIIWTALHSKWTDEAGHVKLISVNARQAPHYFQDGSKGGQAQDAKMNDFDLNTFPADTISIWPDPKTMPKLSRESRYAKLEVVRDVIRSNGIQLLVNWGALDGHSSFSLWQAALRLIGLETTSLKHLKFKYVPARGMKGMPDMSRNVLQIVGRLTQCTWKIPTTTTTSTLPTTTTLARTTRTTTTPQKTSEPTTRATTLTTRATTTSSSSKATTKSTVPMTKSPSTAKPSTTEATTTTPTPTITTTTTPEPTTPPTTSLTTTSTTSLEPTITTTETTTTTTASATITKTSHPTTATKASATTLSTTIRATTSSEPRTTEHTTTSQKSATEATTITTAATSTATSTSLATTTTVSTPERMSVSSVMPFSTGEEFVSGPPGILFMDDERPRLFHLKVVA